MYQETLNKLLLFESASFNQMYTNVIEIHLRTDLILSTFKRSGDIMSSSIYIRVGWFRILGGGGGGGGGAGGA